MIVIDLSHTITPGMPVYPGTESPVVTLACRLDADGFAERKITMFSHTGTHLDAPAHILADGWSLDQLAVERFIGPACKIRPAVEDRGRIELSDLEPYQRLIAGNEFVLIETGWSRYWGRMEYFQDYPVLTPAAARWLAGFPLKGLGIDAISIDEAGSRDFPIHRILLGQEWVIIENLTNLEILPDHGFSFAGLPLKIQAGDGSPVRAVALDI